MRSPFQMIRYKTVVPVPAGGRAFGGDADPPTTPLEDLGPTDNTYSFDGSDPFGAVIMKHVFFVVGPAATLGLNLYFWDVTARVWLPLQASAAVITSAPTGPTLVTVTPPNPPLYANKSDAMPGVSKPNVPDPKIGVPLIYVSLVDTGGSAPSGTYTLHGYPSRTTT